jgi:hypothetical protein
MGVVERAPNPVLIPYVGVEEAAASSTVALDATISSSE